MGRKVLKCDIPYLNRIDVVLDVSEFICDVVLFEHTKAFLY